MTTRSVEQGLTPHCAPSRAGAGRDSYLASSTSYGKRYTATALLNLTSRGEDDDGKAGGAKVIDENQAADLNDLIEASGADKPKFLEWLGVERIQDIPAAKYSHAVKALQAKQGRK